MKAKNLKESICTAGVFFALLLTAYSPPSGNAFTASTKFTDSATAEFLREALSCNRMEIQLALMAIKRADAPEIKALAKNQLQFQEDLNAKLKLLATETGVSAKDELTAKCKDAIDKLSRLKGTLYGRKYLAFSEKNHKKALLVYKDAIEKSGDPKIKSFAAAIIPFFETHNAAIALLSKSVK